MIRQALELISTGENLSRADADAAMEQILARHTGRDEEEVRRDIERDKFLTAEDARKYGILDEVLTGIKRGSERAIEVLSS